MPRCRRNYSLDFKKSFLKALEWARATFKGEEVANDGGEDGGAKEGEVASAGCSEGDVDPERKRERSEGDLDPEQKRERSEGGASPEQKRERSEGGASPEQKRERSEGGAECEANCKRAKLEEGGRADARRQEAQAPASHANASADDAKVPIVIGEAHHDRMRSFSLASPSRTRLDCLPALVPIPQHRPCVWHPILACSRGTPSTCWRFSWGIITSFMCWHRKFAWVLTLIAADAAGTTGREDREAGGATKVDRGGEEEGVSAEMSGKHTEGAVPTADIKYDSSLDLRDIDFLLIQSDYINALKRIGVVVPRSIDVIGEKISAHTKYVR